MQMRFIFIDFEAAFVPVSPKDPIPVTEIGCIVVEYAPEMKILAQFHEIIKPHVFPINPKDRVNFNYVGKNITGLHYPYLTRAGKNIMNVIYEFRKFINEWRDIKILARDPTLENKILLQWGIEDHVEEVLDYIDESMKTTLYYKHSRPSLCITEECIHHETGYHCAKRDVMEIALWIDYYRQDKK